MKKNLILGFFAVLFAVQIAVPISMIVKREDTLKYGTTYRFETEPIDPYDAFRGRYVSLWVRVNKVPNLTGAKFEYAEKVYALLVADEKGFAQVSEVTTRRPESSHYLTATVASGGSTIALRLPIDRYYMEEGAAPRAEKIYREHRRRDRQDAYVVVKVKDGFAVIEGLYVGGQRIEDILSRK